MCILFVYNGSNEKDSDYSFVLISNRDEYYDRPAQCIAPWDEDPTVYGGRDLQSGCESGTWLAVTPIRKKLGTLLNLPEVKKENAKSRGKIVADYVKSELSATNYVAEIRNYSTDCNGFVFVSIEFGNTTPIVKIYDNATGVIEQWSDTYLGFGNCLPAKPLRKVEVGKEKLRNVCSRLNKLKDKNQLIDELLGLLQSQERHLPDLQLETRQPLIYQELSSIFVHIPKGRYGTRAHTIMIVTKSGHVDLIEISMPSPINVEQPIWERKEFNFNL